jgi:mono/diheme cytochrome c family protein
VFKIEVYKTMRKPIIITLMTASLLLMLASCGFDPKKPGRIYMPDMTYSNALETYAPSDIPNEDGDMISARRPVKNTIPRGWIPTDERVRTNEAFLASYMAKNYYIHDAAHWDAEYARAGASIKDPLEFTDENKAEGKRLYSIHCINCHGQAGNGQGNLIVLDNGSDGPYPAVPPDYKARLPQIKDGNIFYSVSYGKGMMGAYGYSLSVKERWQIIHYIKSIAGIIGDDNGTGATGKTASVTPDSTAKVAQR